jgi:hypothetical protein
MLAMVRIFAAVSVAGLVVLVAKLVIAEPAVERTLFKLAVTVGEKPIDVWVTRGDRDDGGLTLRLLAKGVGPKAQSLTLYTGGGDDDGPGGDELKRVTAKVVELPAAGKVVRVDFSYRLPGLHDEETHSTWVGFDGRTHRVLELVTRKLHVRSKQCKEIEETTLLGEQGESAGGLTAATRLRTEAALGEDDLPMDKKCRGDFTSRAVYRWTGEKYVAATPVPSDGGAVDAL